MRPAAICLLSLSFSAALGASSAQAQGYSVNFDGPISTAPGEVFAPANIVAPSTPMAGPAPVSALHAPQPRESVTTETVASIEASQAQALASAERAAVVAAAADQNKVVELGPNAELAKSTMQVGEAGGGLLRTNPSLQRSTRRPMGVKFKF